MHAPCPSNKVTDCSQAQISNILKVQKKEPRWWCQSVFRAPHSHRICAEVSSSAPHCLRNFISTSLRRDVIFRVLCPVFTRLPVIQWQDFTVVVDVGDVLESDLNLLTQACAGSLLAAKHLREVEIIGMVGTWNEYDYSSVVSFL